MSELDKAVAGDSAKRGDVVDAARDVLEALTDAQKQLEAAKASVEHFNVARLSEFILLQAVRGGAVDMYQGSTDELALRCIAMAKSLRTQLENERKGEQPAEAQDIARGDMVGSLR